MAANQIKQWLYQKNRSVKNPVTGKVEDLPLTLEEFEKAYGFEPDGVNLYYGVNSDQVERFSREHTALSPLHQAQIKNVSDRLEKGPRARKAINISLEPLDADDPYGFLGQHKDLLRALAAELDGYQKRVAGLGKTLDVVIRFGSEMNDASADPTHQPWGRRPNVIDDRPQQEKFKDSFRWVRNLFRGTDVLFTFSPILHRYITGEKYEVIERYWPGEDVVDRISCTWYAREETSDDHTALAEAVDILRNYCMRWRGANRPFGIDEIGGALGHDADGPNKARENDRMLRGMLAALAESPLNELTFESVSLFLDADWGRDATLKFLRPSV